MSNNLGIPEIADGMSDIELALNTALQGICDAMTTHIAVDLSSSDVSLTLLQIQRNVCVKITTTDDLHSLTIPQCSRFLMFINSGEFSCILKYGSISYTLTGGSKIIGYMDGTPNGFQPFVSGGGSGGDGIADAPADNQTYGRRNNGWVVVTSGGTGSEGKKWWRLKVDSTSSQFCSLQEIQFRTTFGVAEQATGGFSYSSPSGNNTTANNAFDNNNSTTWVSDYPIDGTTIRFPRYIGYYFPTAIVPAEFSLQIAIALSEAPVSGSWQSSTNSTNGLDGDWEDVVTFNSLTWANNERKSFIPT